MHLLVLRLPGMLAGKSFHSYLGETSELSKDDEINQNDFLLATVRNC